MGSQPETIKYIRENERETDLTEAEAYLYDWFARAYVENNCIFDAALRVGFTKIIARERGKQIYDHGFTRRRIAHLEVAKVTEAEYSSGVNQAFRKLKQQMHSDDPKNVIVAATNIIKIDQAKQALAISSGAVGEDRSAVMEVNPMPTIEDWEAQTVEDQKLLKQRARE